MQPPVRAASAQDSEDEDFFGPLQKRRRGGRPAARAAPPGLLPPPSPQTSVSVAAAPAAPEVDYMAWAPSESPESSSEMDVYSMMTGSKGKSSFNPFGSNFVTLDDIVQQQQQSNGRSSVDRERSSSVANSDLGINETEAEREEREEREKKEFMEALRAARRQQEAVFKDSAPSSSASSIGRVYALDGEAGDESEATETRKSALELLEEQKKGKELKPVDHSKIGYLPFRKNLYIVPRALAKLSDEDVAAKREDLQIKVRGRGCPAPVDSWDQCGLSERILQQLQNLNLVAPFAIQKQAVPAIMCGRDVIGVAKTGSGKTMAFLLPMFRHVLDQPPLRDLDGPIGLIMAPARELAFQIFSECKKFTKVLGLRCGCIYGGAGVAEQIADIKRGMEIAVCTPGRLIDILCMQAGKLLSLQRVSMVVLDEADRMFDMGFEPQLRMVLQNVRPDRQTVLFSATFPKQIEALAKKVLKLPLEIIVGELAAGSVNKDITQIIEVHEESDKYLRLLQLLGTWYEKGSVLIFVDTQDKCDQLFQDLLTAGYPCLSLHGGKDQVDRDHTLHEFKTGVKTVLIATSVAGRGLDVPDIVCVVNFSTPNHIEEYVHRVGRTGRAGRKGTAYTFVSTQEDKYCSVCIRALERAGVEVPKEVRELQAAFQAKVERGEAKAVHSNSGFVGKGFTFDSDEMNEAQRAQAMQKKAYEKEQGLAADDDDDDQPSGAGDGDGGSGRQALASQLLAKLEKARQIAALLSASKNLLVQPSAASIAPASASVTAAGAGAAAAGAATASSMLHLLAPCFLPDGTVDAKAAQGRARQIWAEVLRARSGGAASGVDAGPSGVAHFSEEIDINDYPAPARKRITQKATLDDVVERTGVAIIQRGNYVAPNKKLEPGEKRLRLIIEASTEIAVQKARAEIMRVLEDETLRTSGSGSGGGQPTGGRYSVL